MRHGHDARAEDGERHLSAIGKDQAAAMGERLREMFPGGFDEIHVSPILRAQETGRIVSEAMNMPMFDTEDGLAAGVGTAEYNSRIGDAATRGMSSVLLIGHLPEVVACALEQCGERYEQHANLTIGQGTAVHLEVENGKQPTADSLTVVSGNGSRALLTLPE